MTEFTQTLRHYCRNLRCRSKLPSPASDPRKAFCTRGCHSSFYLKRCVVCEAPFTKTRANQEVCRKARCRRAFREAKERFRYYPTSAAFETSKSPDFIGSKPPPASDRPWRIVAGPELSRLALHCAIVGATEPSKKTNRLQRAKSGSSIPLNVLGGYRWPNAVGVDRRLLRKIVRAEIGAWVREKAEGIGNAPDQSDEPSAPPGAAVRASKSLPDAQTDSRGKGSAAGMALRGRSLVQPTQNNCAKRGA